MAEEDLFHDVEPVPTSVVTTDDERTLSVWDLMLVNIESLIDQTKSGYNKENIEVANKLLENIIDNLQQIRHAFVELQEKSLMEEYANKILCEKPNLITTLTPFMAKVYKCLSNGYELKCLIEWVFLVTIWTNCSQEMCNIIVKENIHIQLIIQLIDLPIASTAHQEILADLIHLSMLALLTLIEHREFHHHFKNCFYSDILISYLPSKNFSIGKLAKMSLALLHRHLDKTQADKYLQLSTKDVAIVFKILSKCELSEDEKSEFWHLISGDGLAVMLKYFCCVQKNCDIIIEQNGLSILMDLFNSSTDADFVEALLLLLWKLASSCLNDPNKSLPIVDKLRLLKCGDIKKELNTLVNCVCYAFNGCIPEGTDDCLLYAENAYKYDLYEECIQFCEKVPQDIVVKDHLGMFQGKSLYHIFMQDLEFLKSISATSRAYSNARLSCYKKIKDVIRLLGSAFDANIIDEEGSQMLDTSMMIFLSESRNMSGKLPRCLLCYKKGKLAKSHICPKAILDDFAKAVGAPDSGKAYFVSWPWQKMFTGSLKSSGEITVRVLCHDCELLLSKAETKFLPCFFHKFYNLERPQSITEEQCIEYQEWLYQFCVGLVFRGMTLQYSGERVEYLNQDEVHSLLLQCRNVLLRPKSDDCLDVSIFIAPTKGDPSEIQSSLINVCIHYPFHFFFTHKKYMYGSHQLYVDALAYTFQIGMILTTVQLPKANWSTDPTLTIQKTGGVYKIPPDTERRPKIPDELWETLLVEAMITEKEVMEQPKRAIALQPLDDLLSVPPVSYMLDILDITKQSEGMGKGSSLSDYPKVINYIPNEFLVSHPTAKNASGTVTLPDSHKILLHLDFPLKGCSGKGGTAFIVVGDSKPPYNVESPYLIFHQYEPGLQENTAFFFSTQSFEFVEYLPDPYSKRFLGDDATTNLIEKSSEIVSLVLKVKGYRNYQSLLYWMNSKRGPDFLDMKCRNSCWYCRDLCEICLDRAILGPSMTAIHDKTLKFCSEQCHKVYNVIPEPQSLIFAPEDQSSNELKVPDGHKEYIRLYSNGKLDDGCFITSLSLCEGDGSEDFPLGGYYMNYYIRTSNYQCHYEYFVSQDLQPLNAVTYARASVNLFDEDDCDDIMQSSINILQGTFMRSGLITISQFFDVLKVQKVMMSTPNSFFLDFTDTNRCTSSNASSTSQQNEDTLSHEEKPTETLTSEQIIEALLSSGDYLDAFLKTHSSNEENEASPTVAEINVGESLTDNCDKGDEYTLTQEEFENHPCFVS